MSSKDLPQHVCVDGGVCRVPSGMPTAHAPAGGVVKETFLEGDKAEERRFQQSHYSIKEERRRDRWRFAAAVLIIQKEHNNVHA